MYFSKRVFAPLALASLASLALAGDDACPIGDEPTVSSSAAEIQTTTAAVAAVSTASSTISIPLSSSSSSTTSVSATTLISQVQVASSTASATASVTLSLSSTSSTASAATATETFWGVGTRYGDGTCTEEDCWQSGACSFVDYTIPSSIDGTTCVSDDIWNNGANCGGCISVTYKGKTITVMVTNRTGGNATHLDMTPDTYAKLTNGATAGGVNDINWEWVTCPIAETTPLAIRMHAGASKYWFAATVENATLRTTKLEVSSDSGSTWTAATLNDPNMWILDGTLPNDTAWVRVTSINGDQVVVENVALKSATVTDATENY